MAKKRPTDGLICIKCPEASFLDPKKEICYKTGGLWCARLNAIVGKYETCRLAPANGGKGARKGGL